MAGGIECAGAGQMQYLKKLILSKSYFDRVPAPGVSELIMEKRYEQGISNKGKRLCDVLCV